MNNQYKSFNSGALNDIEKLKDQAALILKHDINCLQVIPPVAIKLLKLTNDEQSSFKDLSKLIETDPSLSLEVLRLVNSAFYNFQKNVKSIKRAVTALGFSTVRQLALNLLFFKKAAKQNSNQKFNQLFFWQHCLFVAILSRTIAKEINHPDPDMLYASALLHDIGKIILETNSRLSYSDFMDSFKKSSNYPLENEHNFFGMTHAEIGATFCYDSELPDNIIQVVLHHHSPLHSIDCDDQIKQNIAIVSFSDFIAGLQGIGSVAESLNSLIEPDVFKTVNAMNLDMERILASVDDEVRNISSFYNFNFPQLNQLRTNLLESIFKLTFNTLSSLSSVQSEQNSNNASINSLTAPHHSLKPNEIIANTMEALYHEFKFDRIFLLNINPKRRSLVADYSWPESLLKEKNNQFELKISSLSGQLLSCLRNKEAVLVDRSFTEDIPTLELLGVDAFLSLPVLTNNRLSAILYVDNNESKNELDKNTIRKLKNVSTELGIALINAKQFEQEKKKAQVDPLTGLNNKRMIEEYLKSHFNHPSAHLQSLAIGFLDIDHFKSFNDTYGHQAGDDVLTIVSDILKTLTRPGDFLGRYGGEEFLFVLPDTSKEGCQIFSERIRAAIEKKGQLLSKRFPRQFLTVSIGVATYKPDYISYQEMIDVADKAMYQSKKQGRNRVTIL